MKAVDNYFTNNGAQNMRFKKFLIENGMKSRNKKKASNEIPQSKCTLSINGLILHKSNVAHLSECITWLLQKQKFDLKKDRKCHLLSDIHNIGQ